MQKYKIFALTLVHFPKKTYLRAAMSLGRLGLHCSFHICSPSLSCRTFRACGEIGRRARLRIWWFMPCRFESYQAHHNPPPTASQKPSGIFLCPEELPPESPLHLPHEGECSALVLGRVRLVRLVGEPKLRNQKSNKSSKNSAISGSRALPLYGGDGGGSSPLLSLLPQLTQ